MQSEPRRFKFSSRRMIAGIVLFIVAVVVIIGLLWATNVFGWRKWRINEVGQFIGADLPPSARDVQFATDNQKTRVVWLRFAVPDATDVDTFVDQLGMDKPLQPDFTPFPAANFNETSLAWWMPFNAQTFSGLYAIHDGKTYELLLDQTDGADLTLYVRVYTVGIG